MIYNGVITKPELNEETLAHYGIKGMKWKKRIKGKYYSMKSKLSEKTTKFARLTNLTYDPAITTGTKGYGRADRPYIDHRPDKYDYGKADSHAGKKGLKFNDETLAAARKRAGIDIKKNRPLARKKKVVAGKGSVKKRK